jgi:hypothetical protein
MLFFKLYFPLSFMKDDEIPCAGHLPPPFCESVGSHMIITYPPELLPKCEPNEPGEVFVCDSRGQQQLIVAPLTSTPSHESLSGVFFEFDLDFS